MRTKTKIIKLPEISYTSTDSTKMGFTPRGFHRIDFTDRYGENCSLQKSSLATEDAIWLGIDDPKIMEFYPAPRETDEAWFDVTEEAMEKLKHRPQNEISLHGRMHLTRDMVKVLLPYLYNFVKTGELQE